MKRKHHHNRLFDRCIQLPLSILPIHKRSLTNRIWMISKSRTCFILASFIVLVLCSGCSKNEAQKQEISAMIETPKSLLEEAVNWGNENLFDRQMSYDEFVLEEKEMNQSKYQFLLMNDRSNWANELYFVITNEGNLEKLIACGGGNKQQFSYDLVVLSGNCYVAVESASHMETGGLELYPLDNPEGSTYIIDKVIDNHYEGIVTVDENGEEVMKSEIYKGGKLLHYYPDYNGDGLIDISFTGTKLIYEDRIGDISAQTLVETRSCSRTYYYNEEMDRFVLGDQEEIIEEIHRKRYDYTGYLDENSYFAKDNPRKDYDGDGLLDRVYKEFQEDTGSNIFTLEFGNGSKLQLSDMTLGMFFATEGVDLTGDGQNEIIFEQNGTGTGGDYVYLSIFTLDRGSYIRMNNPYEEIDQNNPEWGGMFYLPLKLEKINDTTVSFYQPDSAYQGRITTRSFLDSNGSSINDMEHLYFPDMKDKYVTYGVSSVTIVRGDKTPNALLFQSKLGDKWIYYVVYWKLEFVDGEWEITNVYQPAPVRIDLGEEYYIDLNHDQKSEVICYNTKIVNDGDIEIPVLTLNGKTYDGTYFENEYGISMTNCSLVGYYVMDIDINDSYTEIAILEDGQNSNPLTHVFQYDGEHLTYCGALPDLPESDSFYVNGDGIVHAQKPLSILQTWSVTAEWKYNQNGILTEQAREFYDTYWSPENVDQQNIAKKDLVLFAKPELNQEVIMIKKGETLYLTQTDNIHWIQISDSKGHQGWIYLDKGTEIRLPQGDGKIEDILTNLNVAE